MRSRLNAYQRRYLAEHISVLFLVVGLCALLSISGALSFIDRYIYDNLLKTLPDDPSPDLVIVGMTNTACGKLAAGPGIVKFMPG